MKDDNWELDSGVIKRSKLNCVCVCSSQLDGQQTEKYVVASDSKMSASLQENSKLPT